MHLVVMSRGPKGEAEKFFNELSTRYLPSNVPNGKGQVKRGLLQLRVSPIQLWDISFQKEHLDVVMSTCFNRGSGKPINSRLNKYVHILRTLMGLKPIKKYNNSQWLPMSFPDHVEMIAIGVKDDKIVKEKDGKEYEAI